MSLGGKTRGKLCEPLGKGKGLRLLPKEGRFEVNHHPGAMTAEVAKWASGSGVEKHPTNALVLCPSFYKKMKQACEIFPHSK